MRLCLRPGSGFSQRYLLDDVEGISTAFIWIPFYKVASALFLNQVPGQHPGLLSIEQPSVSNIPGFVTWTYSATLDSHSYIGLPNPGAHSCPRAFANMAGAGRGAAKVLGINLDYRKEPEVSGAASISSVETCEFGSLNFSGSTNRS